MVLVHQSSIRYALILSLVLFAAGLSTTIGQQPKLEPHTVCELTSNLKEYNGKTIAVVGWLGATMEGAWLLGEDCGQKLRTNDFVWPNTLWLQLEPSAPAMARAESLIDESLVRQKLTEVAARTKSPSKQIELAVLYGRLETMDTFETYIGGDGKVHGIGFGHLNSAPAQLVFSDRVIKTLFEKDVKDASKRKR